MRKFEDLSAQVSGLDDVKLEGMFLNGLKLEMQELVYMMKPQSLPELIAVAISMESITLRKMMQKELPGDSKIEKPPISESRVSAPLTLTNWKSRTTASIPEKHHSSNSVAKLLPRPQKHHTNVELDDMRRRSICFKCRGKWFWGHECPNK